MITRDRTKERNCEKAIMKTLAYRAIFNYPMSFYQLTTFLLGKKLSLDSNYIKKEIKRLIKAKKIAVKKDKFFLPSIKPISWDTRLKKTQETLKDAEEVIDKLKSIPWIKMICITGSVAAYNVDKNADIDLFIITTKGRLWITRAFIAAIIKSYGRYPRQKNDLIKICPNLLIDESKMLWSRKKQSVYTANEIALMQPVLNRDDTYFKFIKTNDWIHRYLTNFNVDCSYLSKQSRKTNGRLLNLLEPMLRFIQLKYMEKNKTKEVTKRNFIHFNKNDNYEKINNMYRDFLKKLDLNP